MFVTSIENFIKYIPTAVGTKWTALEPFMDDAYTEMELFMFGTDLMVSIKALDETNQIRRIINKINCLLGYHHAIPFTDLIQTETGFAITSNANLAPASKERVERLISWCMDQSDSLIDLLTEAIRKDPTLLTEWKKFSEYAVVFNTLFVSGNDFARSAKVEGNKRKLFLEAKPEIVSLQLTVLSPVVSKNYMDELITMIQNNNITPDAAPVITLCKQAIGQLYNKNGETALKTLNELSNLLNADIAKYSTYAASAEYALKHSANYENKQTDSTYFF